MLQHVIRFYNGYQRSNDFIFTFVDTHNFFIVIHGGSSATDNQIKK